MFGVWHVPTYLAFAEAVKSTTMATRVSTFSFCQRTSGKQYLDKVKTISLPYPACIAKNRYAMKGIKKGHFLHLMTRTEAGSGDRGAAAAEQMQTS